MEDNKIPHLDPEKILPDVLPDIPNQMEPLEDRPVIQELIFEDTPAVVEPPPVNFDAPEAVEPEDTLSEEIPSADNPPVTEEVFPTQQPAEADTGNADDVPAAAESEELVKTVSVEPVTASYEMTVHNEESFVSEECLPEAPEKAEAAKETVAETPDQEYRDNGKDFDTLFQPSKQPTEPPAEPKTAPQFGNKRRPKRKKGEGLLGIPSILVTAVWLALIVIIGVTAGRMLWICAADVLAFGREDKVVTVSIYEADTMEDIIDKLHEGGLIRYKSLFSLYADISDAEEDIKPGIYDLNTRYDYHALVNFMSPRSSREVIKLTIPEGYTCRQIFSLLEEKRICTALDAAAYAANGELADYWFLNGMQRGSENCLEGYLFPDTYEFYKNSTPREAIEKMLDNFENRFDGEMLTQLEALNSKVTDGSYGVREVVIVASLIEKESAAPSESPRVSGVIYNRLFRWGGNPPYLNIDASIVYAQEGQNARIDTSLDSPYNTYTNTGLTPGPIANPGLSSLKAALNPESHNYYYYVLNPDTGMHQFSTTYEEHTGYVRQFAASTPEVEIE